MTTPDHEINPTTNPGEAAARVPQPPPADQHSDEEDFEALLDRYTPDKSADRAVPTKATIEMVKVVDIRDGKVVVNMGGKDDASINLNEFPRRGERHLVEIGDLIPVVRTSKGVSHRKARQAQEVARILEAKENDAPVHGIITKVVKGGVMADVGVDAFIPSSQIALEKVADLEPLVGREFDALVIEFDAERTRAVLSIRNYLRKLRGSDRRAFLSSLKVGDVITGRVKNVVDFGVFVDLGKVDGFIPREEVSWDKGRAPKDILPVGSEVQVKVTDVSVDDNKVTLSRKRLTNNPWDTAEERYAVGSVVSGKVITIQPYGAFVFLEEGMTGMIHASDMAWGAGNKRPQDYVKLNEEVTCKVIELNREKRRLALSIKDLTKDPWEGVEERFPVGSVVTGTVTSITKYGAFVRLAENLEGMVHVSDISWERHVRHPEDHLKSGQEVEVKVLGINREERRISLGIKQLSVPPMQAFLNANPIGTIVKGKVTRFANFGAFVELAPGLEGLIHVSHIDRRRVESPEEVLHVGEEVAVKILKIDEEKGKISLSRREALPGGGAPRPAGGDRPHGGERPHGGDRPGGGSRERRGERVVVPENLRKTDKPAGMSFGEALKAAKDKRETEV